MRRSLVLFLMLAACGGSPAPVAPSQSFRSFSCTGAATYPGPVVELAHLVWVYEDGSVLTTCIVYDDAGQASTTMLREAGAPEAAQGLCTARYAGAAWTFASDVVSGSGTATLLDAASPMNGTISPLSCSEF